MRKKFDKEKLLIIGILPLMWFVYFLFELFTGRIKSLYDKFNSLINNHKDEKNYK